MGKGLRALVVVVVLLSTQVAWGQCVDLTLTPASLPSGQQGAVYAGATFGATGATLPVTFTTASLLPTGMTLSGGVLAGTPTQSGTFGLRVVATDAEGCLASILLPLVIAPGSVPTITSATSTAFVVGQANSFTVTTTGVPTPTIAQGGDALPSVVMFTDNSDGTGTLSGMPASGTGGTYNLTFTATNGNGSSPAQTFTLTVNQTPSVSGGPFSVAENTINGTSVGTVTVTDPHTPAQTHTWSITAGNTGGAFAIDSSGQITVNTSSALDFETTPSFSLTVQATDNGTPVLSGSATITVNVTNVNEGPTATADSTTVAEGGTVTMLTTPAGATSVRENDGDPDNPLTALTVTIDTAPTNDSAFTLNGDGTFSYTHDGSETTTDSFIYQICDPGLLCDTATVFITITAGNDAPVLTAGATLPYTENQAATAIDPTLTVADADDVNLESATVQITGNYQNGQDVLAFADTATITGTFTAATGLLTLTGSDNLANYEAALRSVTYENTAQAPSPLARTVTWIGTDGTASSTSVTSTITVTAVNDVPVVDLNGPAAGVDYAATFTEGTAVGIVDGVQLTVSDLDNGNLASATVTISDVLNAGVETLAAVTTGTSISAGYTPATGVLSLTGSDTLANYQQVLRTVTYNNTAPNPDPTARVITFVVNDGTDPSATATSTVTVTAVNDAPSFTKGPDQTVNEDAGAQTVNPWATAISDGDGNTQTLTFNVTGNTNASLFSAGPTISATGVLTYTPALNANGNATITVTLSDNGSNTPPNVNTSASQQFTITVTAVNDAPSFTGPNQTVTEDAGAQTVNPWATSISAGPADEASQTLTFAITNNTNPALFSAGPALSSPAGVLTYTPALNANGSATLTVTLTDSGSNTAPHVNVVTQTVTITVTSVNDAPSFTAGGDQTVNEDAGAQSVGWATAITDGDPEVAQTLTFSITGNTNPGLFSAGPAVAANGTLTYTSALNANGSATLTVRIQDNGGTANGGVDTSPTQSFMITVTPVNDPPLVTAPGPFTVTGNVAIAVPGPGLLTTVSDPADGAAAAPFTVNSASFTSTQGGTVSANTGTGAFTYTPPAGYTGADSFTYQVCDSGVPGSACTAATVNVTISDMLWFIDNTAAAGDGRLSSPFNTLAAFQAVNDGTSNNPTAGDNIFLFESATAYVGPVTLLNNQKLIGQDATASLATVAGITLAPNSVALPVMNSGNGVIVTLTSATDAIRISTGASNTLRGFTIGNVTATGTGINMNPGPPAATTFGTLTVLDVGISTNGRALNLSSGTLAATFTGITSTGGANNLNLTNIDTTGTVNLGTGGLSGATGNAVDMNGAGGSGTFTYSGSISNTAAARLVNITNKDGGSVTLSGNLSGTGSSTGINVQNNSTAGTFAFTGGSKVLTTGANPAITLDNNDSATMNFSGGGLVITTTSGAGFTAINGATAINVTGSGNTITSGAGTALNVANSTIGGSGLNFQSITSNASATANGITLDTTGALGGLTVAGTGTAGSGGTIANKQGADGSTTSGIGIYLNSTNNVSLAWMQLNDFQNSAITGRSVNGFTLTNSVINGVIGTNSAPVEGPINFGVTNPGGTNGLQGTGLIRNTKISGGIEHNVEFYNQSGAMSLTIDGTNVVSEGANPNSPADDVADCIIEENTTASGSDGILMEMQGTATATVVIDRCLFRDNKSQAVQAAANDSSAITLTIDESVARRFDQGNEGFILSNGSNGDLTALVSNNRINAFGGTAIFVGQTPGNATASSALNASILNNIVNQPTTATNHGISAFLTSTPGQISQARLRIDGNNVTNNSTSGTTRGILVDTPDNTTPSNTPAFHVTVTNNTVAVGDNVAGVAGLVVQARQSSDSCANINSNTVTFPNGNPGVFGLRARQVAPAADDLEQSASCTGTAAAVLACRNPGATTEVLGTINVVAAGSCLLPNVP